MRLQCEKLSYDEAQYLKVDDWIIVIDKYNDVFVGKVYFAKIIEVTLNHYSVTGFRIDESDTCYLVENKHLSFSNYQDFKYLDVYKLNKPIIAWKLFSTEKRDCIAHILNYNFFERYLEIVE